MSKMQNEGLYRILRPLLYFVIFLYRPIKINHKTIPSKGKVLLVGNHTNYLDCLLVGSATNRSVHFLAKQELTKGVFGKIIKNLGIIPVNRNIKDKDALKNAIDCLNSEKVVAIFPEGTINKTSDIIMPFKYGAVRIARQTNAIVVPFSITGKYKFLRRNVKITFGTPHKIESDDLEKENSILMKKVISLIKRSS